MSKDIDFPRLYAETLRHEHPESVALIVEEERAKWVADLEQRHWDYHAPLRTCVGPCGWGAAARYVGGEAA